MAENPDNFTPGPQQEPDDMQVTSLIDGSVIPSGPRRYTRGQVLRGGFVGLGLGVLAAAAAPRIVSDFFSNEGSQKPTPHENPYPLNPSDILEGSMTTLLTCVPDHHGLALRTAPDTNAPLVDHGFIDSIGVYDPGEKRFIGRNWPTITVGESAHTVQITISNLAVQQMGDKRWGVLQVLSVPQMSIDPKVNGTRSVQNAYFDLSGPSVSEAFTPAHVTQTDTTNLTYHVQHADKTAADIPMRLVDQIANISQVS